MLSSLKILYELYSSYQRYFWVKNYLCNLGTVGTCVSKTHISRAQVDIVLVTNALIVAELLESDTVGHHEKYIIARPYYYITNINSLNITLNQEVSLNWKSKTFLIFPSQL